MFNGLVLRVQQTIGVNDDYVHRVSAHMDWTPDLSAMGSMFGGPRRERMPEINIVFDMQIDLTRFNDAPEITEPENPTVYPLDFIFPSPSTNRG